MVRYSIDDITDEMVLAQSLFTPSGELLLAAGHRITEPFRKRLRELGYFSLMVDVEGTEAIIPETIISEHVQREMAVTLNKSATDLSTVFTYKKTAEKAVQDIIADNKEHIEKLVMNSGIAATLEKMIQEILDQPGVVLNLSALDQANKEFFAHVMNVTVVALCIGRKYRLSYDEMKQLGTGALNYDVGLLAIPRDVIDKPDPLTQDDIIHLQQHTVYGHLILSQNPGIPPTSSAVALQHHEFQDGSGYPRGIAGDNRPPLKDFSRQNKIHRFAEIVAVADAYDMLVTGRPHYARRVTLPAATKRLIAESGTRYNADIVKTLLSMVPQYPVGARIRVVNAPVAQLIGYTGAVAKSNEADSERPQVVLYETKHHQRVKPVLIDLAQHSGFVIELLA